MRYCWAQCVKARSKSELLRVNLDIKILKEIFCSIEHLLYKTLLSIFMYLYVNFLKIENHWST